MNWYTHACTWTQGLLRIQCSKLQDVIPSIILSKKSCINICLITDHYIKMNIWIFQDTVWYQLLHHSYVTSTCGKHYSLVPCTGFGQQAWPVKSLGIMLLDYFLCKHERNCLPAKNTGKKTTLAVNDGVHWPHAKWLNYQKNNKLPLKCAELCIQNGGSYFKQ